VRIYAQRSLTWMNTCSVGRDSAQQALALDRGGCDQLAGSRRRTEGACCASETLYVVCFWRSNRHHVLQTFLPIDTTAGH
jgi:hypothetical protein